MEDSLVKLMLEMPPGPQLMLCHIADFKPVDATKLILSQIQYKKDTLHFFHHPRSTDLDLHGMVAERELTTAAR